MYKLAVASLKTDAACVERGPACPVNAAPAIASDRAPRMFELPPGKSTGVTRGKAEHWLYVVAGRGVVQRNGAPISLKRGTLVVIHRKERHEIVNDGAEVLRAISMNSAFAESVPARRWFEATSARFGASAGIAAWVISLFHRLLG